MSTVPFPLFRSGSGLVFTSGLAAIDPTTLTVSASTFDEQVTDVFGQLDEALAAAGSTRALVLHLECYLADHQWFAPWNAAFTKFFATTAPARITTVTTLPIDGLLIEIQAIAIAAHQEDRS